ncbi:MAG: hypothetical protein KJP08_11060 [Gammaproteobacteria bacterium]|nr:hypothetical protein [Gammaproteobacteria bacterium]NNF50340.1 hypothetical protein [Woeseiaceae bacterium]NNL64587.1 hypothetical protein [Woeseiaceae bacterium]
MFRQILNKLAVTIAFGAGAILTAMVLDIGAVQAYLGMAPLPAADLLRIGLTYVGVALSTGLVVDGIRLISASWWHKDAQAGHKLENLFQANLA